MDAGGERIGVNGAAALLDVTPEKVRHFVQEGRLRAERGADGDVGLALSEVLNLARGLEAEAAEEEIFDGEVIGDDPPANSRLPAVPFERYERLLQQGQDYKTRREERSRQIEEVRQERDAARMEIDRLWSEIERLNLVEFQRELQEKTISTLEEEKQRLEADRGSGERLPGAHRPGRAGTEGDDGGRNGHYAKRARRSASASENAIPPDRRLWTHGR